MVEPGPALPSPPLWTWAAAVTLAVAALAGLAVFEKQHTASLRASSFNIARFADSTQGPRTIVFIGSSKTRCALETDPVFTARLQQQGTDFRSIRLVEDGILVENLPEVFEAVIRLKPRIVLLESDLIIYEPRFFWKDNKVVPSDWRRSLRSALLSLKGEAYVARRAQDNRALAADRSCVYTAHNLVNMDAYVAQRLEKLAKRSASKAAERAPYLSFLQALRAKGTEVALLRLPPRPDAAGQMPAAAERAADAVRATLAREENLFEVRVAAPVTPASFHDAGHMAPEGRNSVSAWLADYLAKKLAAKPAP